MTNSDNGNRHRPAAHQPGDRVRIRHSPAQNAGYSVEQNQARQALDGQIGSIRERTVAGAYRVAPPGSTERGAWFEADELEPPLPPIGSRVRVKAGLHEGRVLEVKRHHRGEILAEQGPRMGWYDPSEVEPWGGEEPVVTDADGFPVGGPSPLVDRPAAELRAGALTIVDAFEAKLGTAAQEAARWHEAAQDARQEAREAKERLGAAEAERDALRGKLGAAEAKLAAVAQAWSEAVDAWRSGDAVRRHRAEEAVDKALGGVAAKPVSGPAWATEGDPWRAEVESRLAALETMGTGMGTDPTARAREPKQGRGE